jgi:hypothetical protein
MKKILLLCFALIAIPLFSQEGTEAKKEEVNQVFQKVYTEITLEDFEKHTIWS